LPRSRIAPFALTANRAANGAVIVAADPARDGGSYDEAEDRGPQLYQDFGHSHWHNSMICGVGVKDVAIAGPGLICGNGLRRGEIDYASAERGGADKIIALKECHNVTLSGFSVVGTPHIAILATGVDGIFVDHPDLGRLAADQPGVGRRS